MKAQRSRRAVVLLAIAVAMMMMAVLAPAAFAASTYNGGPDEYPSVVANDHTAFAVHLATVGTNPDETGLAASTQYRVKVRFSPSPTPSSTLNRGFVWNPSSGLWAQERVGGSDWSAQPTVTTNANGQISGNAGWLYAKFGDTSKSGTYYLLISLQPATGGGSGTTMNPLDPPAVTVVSMPAGGFWVHDGEATGATGGRRVEASAGAVPGVSPFLSLQKVEPNTVDDDADGVVDNEIYGVNTPAGGFRVAVPTATALNAYVGSSSALNWSYLGAVSATPDVDVALSNQVGADMAPPSAPTDLAATRAVGEVTLSWTAATDDTAVAAYRVYRWTAAPTAYESPVKRLIATVGATTYEDTSVQFGEEYWYEVRAADAATNVGPRSNTVRSLRLTTELALTAPPTVADGAAVALQGSLSYDASLPLSGAVVTAQSSPDGSTWTDIGACAAGAAAGTYTIDHTPTVRTYYRLVFAGDGEYAGATSEVVTCTPERATALTLSAPATVAYGGPAKLAGMLTYPTAQPLDGVTVTAEASTDGGATWLTVGTCTAGTTAGSYELTVEPLVGTQYRLRFAGVAVLPADQVAYAAAVSAPVTVKPRLEFLTTPSAPSIAYAGRRFYATGYYAPYRARTAGPVRIACYQRVGSTYKLKKTVTASYVTVGGVRQYRGSITLTRGTWRLRAVYKTTATYAKTSSPSYRTISVR